MTASSTCSVRVFHSNRSTESLRLRVTFYPLSPPEKFFQMKRSQCKDGLEIYKRFLTRMTRVSEFFKIAEVKSRHSSCSSLSCWIQTALFSFTANGDRQKWHPWTHTGKSHEEVQIDHGLRNDQHLTRVMCRYDKHNSRVNIGLMKLQSWQHLSLTPVEWPVCPRMAAGNYSLHKSAAWSFKLHISRWSH